MALCVTLRHCERDQALLASEDSYCRPAAGRRRRGDGDGCGRLWHLQPLRGAAPELTGSARLARRAGSIGVLVVVGGRRGENLGYNETALGRYLLSLGGHVSTASAIASPAAEDIYKECSAARAKRPPEPARGRRRTCRQPRVVLQDGGAPLRPRQAGPALPFQLRSASLGAFCLALFRGTITVLCQLSRSFSLQSQSFREWESFPGVELYRTGSTIVEKKKIDEIVLYLEMQLLATPELPKGMLATLFCTWPKEARTVPPRAVSARFARRQCWHQCLAEPTRA